MLPTEPMTRTERYLARLAGQDVSIPDTPITREEEYLAYIISNGGGVPAPNAGAHNSIFRGKNLGSSYTSAQADAIDAGTFDGLFVGDYWEMPWGESETPIKFRIAGFDYFYGVENPNWYKHHCIIVPDSSLGLSVMYETGGDASIAAYSGSYMLTTFLPSIASDLQALFGGNVLPHRINITGTPSTRIWTDGVVDLISASMISNLGNNINNIANRIIPLPLFMHAPNLCATDVECWLQDYISATSFMSISMYAGIYNANISNPFGVRPYFCLGKAPTP